MEFCRRWGIADWVRDAPYPRRLSAGLRLCHRAQRLRARARAVPRPRASSTARRRARRSASACRRTCSIRSCGASRRPFRTCTLRYDAELTSFEETAERCRRAGARRRDRRDPRRSRPTIWSAPTAAPALVRERLGIAMSGNPALTYTTNVMFRCADFTSLHDKGRAYRFIFIGPEGTWLTIVAINGGDRFRMSIVGTADKVDHTEADIRAALTRADGPRLRLRDPVGDALGAARARRRQLRDAARLHRRRRRAPDVADRRLRHEHRHPGRRRSRLEARGGAAAAGAAARCCAPTRSSAGRSAVRNVTEASRNLGRMLADPPAPAARRRSSRPGRPATPRARSTALVRRDDAARVVHARLPPRLPLRQLAHRLRRRHAGAAASDRKPMSRPRGRARVRRTSGCPTAAPRSICSAAASCCCGSGRMRPMPRACGARQRRPACRST